MLAYFATPGYAADACFRAADEPPLRYQAIACCYADTADADGHDARCLRATRSVTFCAIEISFRHAMPVIYAARQPLRFSLRLPMPAYFDADVAFFITPSRQTTTRRYGTGRAAAMAW